MNQILDILRLFNEDDISSIQAERLFDMSWSGTECIKSIRKQRNRESAASSRLRKTRYIKTLEMEKQLYLSKIREVEFEKQQFLSSIKTLESEKRQLCLFIETLQSEKQLVSSVKTLENETIQVAM